MNGHTMGLLFCKACKRERERESRLDRANNRRRRRRRCRRFVGSLARSLLARAVAASSATALISLAGFYFAIIIIISSSSDGGKGGSSSKGDVISGCKVSRRRTSWAENAQERRLALRRQLPLDCRRPADQWRTSGANWSGAPTKLELKLELERKLELAL